MIQSVLVKILLFPFSMLYGAGISLRNFFYRTGVLKEVSFNLPVISVGNLSVGGTGKTPHIEYLIRLLKNHIHLATLSRGYKRKSEGYLEILPTMNAEQAGDEPLEFKRKFPEITVTVCESRTFGILEILKKHPETQTILLDDAFQHLSVKPGLNILLTEYARPFTRDLLLPAGRLREWRNAYRRAHVIVVTKCPDSLDETERRQLHEEINPLPYQSIYFSRYKYLQPYHFLSPQHRLNWNARPHVLLLSAIANASYLHQYLNGIAASVRPLEFEDHHYFTNFEIGEMETLFNQMPGEPKIILTTEKDATRLELHRPYLASKQLPLFVLPVEVEFLFGQGPAFDQEIRDHLLHFRV